MTQTLSVLMAQINPTVGAINANCEHIIRIIKEHSAHYDVIVFPELALSGYPPEDLLFRKEFHHAIMDALQEIQNATEDCHVILGHPMLEEGHCYNSLSVLHDGQIIRRYHKQNIPNYDVFDERRYFTPGRVDACILRIKGHTIGLCICEDLWLPGPVQALIREGISLLISINASPFDKDKYTTREKLLKSYAEEGINQIYVNLVGGQDELLFDGQSFAMDASGAVCARGQAFAEDLCEVHINHDSVYGPISLLQNDDELLYNALVFGTREYVEKNRFPGVLLGLSGGIDSALTLAIAVDALGPKRVQAVMMPSPFTAAMSAEDALKQLDALQVSHTTLSIEPIFKTILNTLAPEFNGLPWDTTEENIQARIRGLLLMALSNKSGKMVLTTSNKSETAVGYATLYGDMAGGFAVLKDVLKTEVYALAKYRNSISPIIPTRVITRAPSAELKADQKDQDSLPDYAILDGILIAYMEHDLSPEEIVAQDFRLEDVARVIELVKKNEYKRKQAAPGIKVSKTAFGKDWRYPITNGFNPHVRLCPQEKNPGN